MANLTIRTDDEIVQQIGQLAEAMDRPKTWVIEDALRQYLCEQAWQVEGIKQAQKSLEEDGGVQYDAVMKKLQNRITRRLKKSTG